MILSDYILASKARTFFYIESNLVASISSHHL